MARARSAASTCRPIARKPNVAPIPIVETYAALRLCIDNWRWAGVPFYLRTGKRLPKRTTEIAIRFKEAPSCCSARRRSTNCGDNWLILQIQPDEGIRLRFNAKSPGPGMALESVAMDFHYTDWFKQAPAVGYETLLYDCIHRRRDACSSAPTRSKRRGRVVEPALEAWSANSRAMRFPELRGRQSGPEGGRRTLARDGRAWRAIR